MQCWPVHCTHTGLIFALRSARNYSRHPPLKATYSPHSPPGFVCTRPCVPVQCMGPCDRPRERGHGRHEPRCSQVQEESGCRKVRGPCHLSKSDPNKLIPLALTKVRQGCLNDVREIFLIGFLLVHPCQDVVGNAAEYKISH